MNSTNHSPHERSGCEALLDQLERQLRVLTTAPLDAREGSPRECVDEFANEFLGHWRLPPRGRSR